MTFIPSSHPAGFDTRSFYGGDLGEEEVAHELKLVRCWSVFIIGSLSSM